MCIICVEIMKGNITVKEAGEQMKESMGAGNYTPASDHLFEIVEADHAGDTKKVAELVKAGYRKERWI